MRYAREIAMLAGVLAIADVSAAPSKQYHEAR
jgi:hypothetical protein